MKRWHSVSTRLSLMLLSLTLGSLAGLSLVLDIALKNFFIRDAQATLQRQANVLAAQAQSKSNREDFRQWADLIANRLSCSRKISSRRSFSIPLVALRHSTAPSGRKNCRRNLYSNADAKTKTICQTSRRSGSRHGIFYYNCNCPGSLVTCP